jgi:predicted Fe-Mo cluster-binding NifX family protein
MKVCFAAQKDEGLKSAVYDHFGSAPAFIAVDTAVDQAVTVDNNGLHHVHGACNPIRAMGRQDVETVVVGGNGAGAVRGLNSKGIRVFKAVALTVKQNLDLLGTAGLPRCQFSASAEDMTTDTGVAIKH